MMPSWARTTSFYHILIDRFATGRCRFRFERGPDYGQRLQHWMGGNLKGITASLDYLEDLGIGAILLTPFFRGDKYHGYWTTSLREVDPHLGSEHDLRQLVQDAHRRDIRVVMDLPFTHCHVSAYPPADAQIGGEFPSRAWFSHDGRGAVRGFFGDPNLPELDLDHAGLRRFLNGAISHWLSLGFDGIRFDHAKRPPHSFWQALSLYLADRHPQAFLIGENWPDSGEVGSLAPYMHGELNFPVSLALRNLLARPGPQTVHTLVREFQAQQPLRQPGYLLPTFLDSHDLERASLLARGDPSRLALAFLVQMTLPYPPILYYGSERAQAQSDDLAPDAYERDRFFREPMQWDSGREMAAWVRKLLAIRSRNIGLFTSEPISMQIKEEGILSYGYRSESATVMVAANWSPRPRSIRLPRGAPARDLTQMSETAIDIAHQPAVLRLGGYRGAILEYE